MKLRKKFRPIDDLFTRSNPFPMKGRAFGPGKFQAR